MENEFISRHEHEEFARRMEEENERQNHRIKDLEGSISQINDLTRAIDRLALSVKSMCEVQKAQGDRLSSLEGRDGENWRTFLKTVGTCLVSTFVGFLISYLAG